MLKKKFKTRYALYGSEVWLERRLWSIGFFSWWQKVEPFSNHMISQEQVMNDAAKKLEEAYIKREQLQAELIQIREAIRTNPDSRGLTGPVTTKKLSLFRPKRLGRVASVWQKFADVLRGTKSIADKVSSVHSVKPKGLDVDEYQISSNVEVTGESDFPVLMKSEGNRKGRRGGNPNN